MSCDFNNLLDNIDGNEKEAQGHAVKKTFGTCELRSYRLALATTGE